MTRYVIDAPTLLHLVTNDVEVNAQHQLVAPSVLLSQALSLLFQAMRRDEITERLALQHHDRMTEMKMRSP